MSAHDDLQLIESIIDGLDKNPVARFSYTQEAFDSDDADGVDVFDMSAAQNIPKATHTDYNSVVLEKGVRAQGASIPRMGWNHYVGRLSYNLNKLVQKFLAFCGVYRTSLAHNANEYDSAAKYRHGDICYVVEIVDSVRTYAWYQRKSSSPESIANIPPSVTLHWEEMQSKTSSSALLPFSASGYRHKFTIADLTGAVYDTAKWYPVTTEPQDFEAKPGDPSKTEAPQVLIEIFCNGQVAGRTGPHRAELAVLSKFTGFADSSTDILLNNSFVDETNGSARPLTESPVGYSKLAAGRQAVIWLRGGTKYALWNGFGSDFTLHTAPYANGYDSPIDVSGIRVFDIAPGTFKARIKSTEATEPDDAVVKAQVDGALSMPKTLGAGAQLNSVRAPGSYVVTDVSIADSIQQTPIENPGTFELVVKGDREGLSVTVQQFTARETGKEYTRVLTGGTVLVPWYLSGSPDGLEVVGFNGLFVFDVDEDTGNLLAYYDGKDEPSFRIDSQTGHLIWYAPEDPKHILDVGKVVGAGISDIAIDYQTGDSGTAAPTGTWSAAPPAPQQGKYLWTRTQITLLDGSETSVKTSYSVAYYGIDGRDGTDAPAMSFAIDDDEDSPTYGHLMLTLT
jgi:hypothetical protein